LIAAASWGAVVRTTSPGLLGASLPVAISGTQTNVLGQLVDGKMIGRTGP